MEFLKSIKGKPFVKNLVILAFMVLVLYLLKSMITMLLLTFIFIYLINTAQKFVYKYMSRIMPVRRSYIVIFIYVLLLFLLALILYIYAPKVVTQSVAIIKTVIASITNLSKMKATGNPYVDFLIANLSKIKGIDLSKYAESAGKFLVVALSNFGGLSVQILISILLSFFFMLEKNKIMVFMSRFKDSKVGWLYDEVRTFGKKFTNSFGKVIQTQILISLINSIISVIILSVMHFPNTLGLWVMIFLFGLVPIAGVFISLVPLSIIAYNIGSVRYVIYILVLIAVLHAFESYVLNPKLMSHNTKLPIFFTFLILIVSEHFFGIWGLIVGIPITMFILDLLDVKTV